MVVDELVDSAQIVSREIGRRMIDDTYPVRNADAMIAVPPKAIEIKYRIGKQSLYKLWPAS